MNNDISTKGGSASGKKNIFTVAGRFLRNKYYVSSYYRRIRGKVADKIENWQEFLTALKYDSQDKQKLLLKFKDGYSLECYPSDLMAIGETGVLEDYHPNSSFDIKPGDIVFDVGAHMGSFSIYAANKGAHVFAFEPLPENFKRLCENITLNHMEGKVTAINEGIFYKTGELPFFFDNHNTGGNSIISTDRLQQATNIKVDTIGHYVKQFGLQKIDLLKIDIEGAEYDIFRNLSDEEFKYIEKIVGEYHLSFEHSDNFFSLKKMLQPHFKAVKYYGPYYFYALR